MVHTPICFTRSLTDSTSLGSGLSRAKAHCTQVCQAVWDCSRLNHAKVHGTQMCQVQIFVCKKNNSAVIYSLYTIDILLCACPHCCSLLSTSWVLYGLQQCCLLSQSIFLDVSHNNCKFLCMFVCVCSYYQ